MTVDHLRYLYESEAAAAHRFRYALLAFDMATVLFIVVTSFLPRSELVERIDVAIGIIILFDFLARMLVSRHRLRDLLNPVTWADIAAITSFLAPIVGEGAGFLRIIRTVRLLYTYQLLRRLRQDSRWFAATRTSYWQR